jgi:Protein of unknown function (DUF1232)
VWEGASAKVVVALAGLWLLSPIDLLPEFLPVIGPLDDVLVVALALRCLARCWSQPGRVSLGCWNACSVAQHQQLASGWEPRLGDLGPAVGAQLVEGVVDHLPQMSVGVGKEPIGPA